MTGVQTCALPISEAARTLKPNGYFFISELHPAKQYFGSKARFEINQQTISPDCFTHHVSDYFSTALNNGFCCKELDEWFDGNDRALTPRLISFLFKKN